MSEVSSSEDGLITDGGASTIASEGDIVLSKTSGELDGNWRSDLEDTQLTKFDAADFPDDVEDDDRVYFEMDGLLFAQSTVREVGEETVWTTGAIHLRIAADCPVDVPAGRSARLEEGGVLRGSDRNISSDTVVDVEGSR